MSTLADARWRLLSETREGAACVFCDTGAPLVETALQLDGERRLYICADCVTGLARTARVGTKAAESLRAEYENEIGKRDLRLTALAEQLSRAETTIKEQREEVAAEATRSAKERRLASTAVAPLQADRMRRCRCCCQPTGRTASAFAAEGTGRAPLTSVFSALSEEAEPGWASVCG